MFVTKYAYYLNRVFHDVWFQLVTKAAVSIITKLHSFPFSEKFACLRKSPLLFFCNRLRCSSRFAHFTRLAAVKLFVNDPWSNLPALLLFWQDGRLPPAYFPPPICTKMLFRKSKRFFLMNTFSAGSFLIFFAKKNST